MKIEITDREFHTILAALRFRLEYDLLYLNRNAFYDLASNGGACAPLTLDEIDDLCQRLNTSPGVDSDDRLPGDLSYLGDLGITMQNGYANLWYLKAPVIIVQDPAGMEIDNQVGGCQCIQASTHGWIIPMVGGFDFGWKTKPQEVEDALNSQPGFEDFKVTSFTEAWVSAEGYIRNQASMVIVSWQNSD